MDKGDKVDKKEEKKEEPLVFEPITIELIRQDKAFQKTTKKHQKEYDTLKKKQAKEKMAMQKTQCSAIDKIIKGKKCVIDKDLYYRCIYIFFQQKRSCQ